MKMLTIDKTTIKGATVVLATVLSVVIYASAMASEVAKEASPGNQFISTGSISTKPGVAQIQAGNVNSVLAPNARGDYPRLSVSPSTIIVASVLFPDASPGERISIQAEDGGQLRGEAAKGFATIDDIRKANIEFQVSAHDGLYRVTLRRGGESRVLQFWVGPEAPVL